MSKRKIVIVYEKAADKTAAFHIFRHFPEADFFIYDTGNDFTLPPEYLPDKNRFRYFPCHRILAKDPLQKKLQIRNDTTGCVFSIGYDALFRFDHS